MKKSLLIFTISLLALRFYAQGVDDALFNSQTYYEGTARSMAMGNATGAVGGDITAVCINPAGLGLYRSHEFTFSLGPQYHSCLSDYYGSSEYTHKFRTTVPNMGLVFGGEVSNYKPLRYLMFAVGMTRTNEFSYRQRASGLNPGSSMVDAYLQTVNGIDELFQPMSDPGTYFSANHPYDLNPAWETYLIDRYIDSLGNLYFDSPVPPGNVWQTDNVSSKGRSEEWTIASAFNLYDKLFVGTSLGLAHLKRISTRTYEETPNDPNSRFFDWKLEEELGDTAWGVNFKAGLIYYPASWLRIGAAWHSRTVYAFGEQWSTEIQTTLKNSHGQREVHRYLSPVLYQTYEFHTPHTFTGSLAFIIRQQGMISADVDYMDYGTSWFSFDGVNIRDVLKPTYNFRLGTEWRLRQYYLRGGLAYYGSPYGFGETYGSVKKLGLGFGYAVSQETSWDFAYELTQSTTGFTPYQVYIDGQNIVEDAVRHQWRNKLVVTLKIKIKE